MVARPLEQGRAFSPDSYSAAAVRHVRPFLRKSVRFKAFGICPSNVGLSVVYISGNMGGRGFSRADDEFRTQVMLNVSTYCAAVPPSVGGEKLEYLSASRVASAADFSSFLIVFGEAFYPLWEVILMTLEAYFETLEIFWEHF